MKSCNEQNIYIYEYFVHCTISSILSCCSLQDIHPICPVVTIHCHFIMMKITITSTFINLITVSKTCYAIVQDPAYGMIFLLGEL